MAIENARTVSEREIIFLIGLAQFVNVLDFMIVLPLGPDYARELAIAPSMLGMVAGSYTAAAAVAGLAASRFLDRWDRRTALATAMAGLVAGTIAAGFATSLWSLLAARMVAGACGGPATALGLSIVSDAVPSARRGKALGAVMGAFAIASVVGVPLGLELGRRYGWRAPLFVVAALGAVVLVGVAFRLPKMRAHLTHSSHLSPLSRGPVRLGALMARAETALAMCSTASIALAGFSIIPNVSAYLQGNCGFPRAQLGLLYLAGGVPTFFVLRIAGRAADRFGSPPVALVGTGIFLLGIGSGFATGHMLLHPAIVFILMMSGQSIRNVSAMALASKVPGAHERAGFQALQSSVQHLGCALGAVVGASLLSSGPGDSLIGMPKLAAFAMLISLPLPELLRRLQLRLVHTVSAPPIGTAIPSD